MILLSNPVAKSKKVKGSGDEKEKTSGNIRVSPELSHMITIIVANRRKRIPNYSAGQYVEPMIEDQVAVDYEEELRRMNEDLKTAARQRKAPGAGGTN